MRLTRRNTLIGLGTLAGGFGLVSATGAFDTVQADRQFNVEIDDDSEALLELTPGDGSSAEEYVDDEDGTIGITIGADELGLNREALTTFNDLIAVGNNGTQDVRVWFSTDETVGIAFIDEDGSDITDRSESGEVDDPVTINAGDAGEDAEQISLEIDTRTSDNAYDGAYDDENAPFDITIHADVNA